MALWEYKVITSGPHGFASPALLEAHLNALGKDEWEIIHFQTLPNNPLAFHGLARRSTTRDWTPPEIAVAPAPKPAAYEPPATAPAKAAEPEEKRAVPPALAEGEAKGKAEDASLRPMRNTERDLDPDAEEDDDWDSWEESQDELPTFFEAIKPHLRRNQKGPGMSVAVDYLAKRWDQKEADIVGALKECGLTLPETEEADPEYFEFEGDLYWVNRNNRGQFFLNTREKPRPTFRTAPAKKLASDDPAAAELVAERAAEKAEIEKRRAEREERQAASAAAAAAKAAAAAERAANTAAADPSAPAEPLPAGQELLEKIQPLMRRNRRGPGYSGSITFLSRALKTTDADLVAALAALGLNVPDNAGDKPVFVEIGSGLYWMNKDNRGGVWINGRENKAGAQAENVESPASGTSSEKTETVRPAAGASEAETAALQPELPGEAGSTETAAPESTAASDTPAPVDNHVLSGVRVLLKPNKRGSGVSGEVGYLARTVGKSEEEFMATLTGAGLAVPPDSEAKPVFVEHAGEIFWFNKNSTDGSLWLNAKPAKSARRPSGGSRPRAPRKPKAPKE